MITDKSIKRLAFIIIQVLTGQLCVAQSPQISGKTWAYKKVAIIYQQDTLVLFHADSVKNIWYLGRVSLALKANRLYAGTDLNGSAQSGSWALLPFQRLIVDNDTNLLASVTDRMFVTTSPIRYQDSSRELTGTLLTIFYAITPQGGLCDSMQSGQWQDSTIWSCGHEPTVTDVVVLNHDHTVTLGINTAMAQRIVYHGGKIQYVGGGKIFIKAAE